MPWKRRARYIPRLLSVRRKGNLKFKCADRVDRFYECTCVKGDSCLGLHTVVDNVLFRIIRNFYANRLEGIRGSTTNGWKLSNLKNRLCKWIRAEIIRVEWYLWKDRRIFQIPSFLSDPRIFSNEWKNETRLSRRLRRKSFLSIFLFRSFNSI